MSVYAWRPARRGPLWLLTLLAVLLLHGLAGVVLVAWVERPPPVLPGRSVAVDILPLPPEAQARLAELEAAGLPLPELTPLPIPELPLEAADDSTPPAGLQAVELPAARAGSLPASRLCATRPLPNLRGSSLSAGPEITVQGTVQGGRVVAVRVLDLRGAPDASAQRLLSAAVEAALRTGYQCATDGVFEQTFAVRSD